jgi:hypothetical protein
MKGVIQYLHLHKTITFFVALLWSALIFYGCSMPGKDLPKVGLFDHADKLIHFTFFVVFFILWYCRFGSPIRLVIIAAAYGLAIEFYQLYFVPGRSFDIWDAVADALGALLAWLWIRHIMPEAIPVQNEQNLPTKPHTHRKN